MPASCESHLELELDPEPASVTRARQAFRLLAREVGAPEDDVALAVSEAVGNAVRHAYRGGRTGKVRVRATTRDDRLKVEVADDGNGMSAHVGGGGLGLGISLISRAASDVRLSSSEAGTTVSMTFALGGAS